MQDGRRTAESESSSRATRDPRHDVLFTPLRIGPKETRNRFYQVPQCGPGGTTTPWTQAAHREVKAEGGWGVVCVEETVISGDSDQVPLYMGTLLDDEDVARYALTCDAVHRHGSLAGVELSHGGLRCWNRNSRLTSIAPSAMALGGAVHGSPPVTMARAMDEDDIRRLQADWVRAARRAIEAGFDVIYVYGSAGYLPAQFLSPRTNLRTDKYGGSFENRARFLMETLSAVREEIDGEAALAVRISVDRSNEPPYAIDISQLAQFMTLADDLVDLWDINDNGVDPAFTYGGIDSTPGRFYEEGYLVKPTAPLRDSTSKPIVGVARLTDPNLMAQIISSGTWDLIGAARPSIADPFLPRKIEEGSYDEIRECTGSNLCIMSVRHNGNAVCVQNATAFEEHRRGWHPERFERATNADNDVLVVGAGPAGMECAIVLAKRGFERIHLVDSTEEIGGHLRWTTQLPGQGAMARLINWRRIQIDKLSAIEVITGRTLTADEVRTYGAELVVVATGARWSTEGLDPWSARPIPGLQADVPYILTPEQLMVEKKALPGDRVVIYDSEGYYCGAGIAEQLAVQGCKVTIATPMGSLAPVLKDTKETFLLGKRIHELGIEVLTNMTAVGANSEGLQVSGYLGDKHEIKADAVVSITSRVVNDTIYQQLAPNPEALREEGIVGLYRAGDCHAPRLVTEAIFDGHRLAREIDSEDPAVPRPYLRELAKVGRVSA